ncbi:MAG: hypothetical protein FJ029_06750, partial [Actinobacteria bacterium]|nr:hypothetical protein [Actinomycetota bacterium]
VFVCGSRAEAHVAIDRICRRREFGPAGERLVIQDRLRGRELSVFALCDGLTYQVLGAARDYKRAFDDDRGPNTGGMGAYTPVADATPALMARIEREIIGPTLDALQAEGCPFTGFLYAGLMLTAAGPQVLEFNGRLGDPEAQAILPTLELNLVDAMLAALDGRLVRVAEPVARSAAVAVVVASDGYPGTYASGHVIEGLERIVDGWDAGAAGGIPARPPVTAPDRRPHERLVFHAGTTRQDGTWRTAGGRVLSAVGLGPTVPQARERAYALAATVTFPGARYRADIAMIQGRGEVAS